MKKNSAFTLRSGNRPSIAKLTGVSPVKKDFIGPIIPIVDKDKDNISDFIDKDGGSGKSNEDEPKTKKLKNNQGPKGLKPQDPVKNNGIESVAQGLKKGLNNKKVKKRRNNILPNQSRNIGDLRNITHIPGFGLDR